MELKEGAVIADRFRLVRQLGQGGMGEVWAAQHISLEIPCAVKFIHGESADKPEVRMRFQREAKAAAQLRSPNVVQILDHGVFENVPYIAMEYLDGEPLNARLKRRGRLDALETFRIIAGVGKGLSKAHAAGIVHRDLKPENIFLVRDEDTEIPKVLDFGVAKSTTTLDSNTRTGALLGTPYYMSPEQAQGTKTVDHRADLWSLAVVTFRCLTGELPFKSTALGDLLIKIVTHPAPVPSHLVPGLPEGFDVWWQRASQRDPDQRYQSAKELVDALGLALGVSVPTHLGHTPMPGTMQKTALLQATVVADPATGAKALPFEQSSAGASGPHPAYADAMAQQSGHTHAMPAGAVPAFGRGALGDSGASGSVAGLTAPRRPNNGKTVAVVGAAVGALALLSVVVAVLAFGETEDTDPAPAGGDEPVPTETAAPTSAPEEPDQEREIEEPNDPPPAASETASAIAPRPPAKPPVPVAKAPPPPPPPPKTAQPPTTLDVPEPPPPAPKPKGPDFGF